MRAAEDATHGQQEEINPTVPHIQGGEKEIQMQQNQRQTILQTLCTTHTDDLLAQKPKFNLDFIERWRRKGENREIRGKPN